MANPAYIPKSPQLRAEQVESWAFQSGSWNRSNDKAEITSHHSANLILEAVEEDEKPALLSAWARGYKNGKEAHV